MTPFTDRTGRFSPLKALTLAVLVAPALWLLYRYLTNDLGPLMLKEANHFTGLWTVRFLVATLALTPAQRILNWPKLALIRRMTGIAAFSYALAHFTLYIAMSKFDLGFVASEIVHRYYLAIGFAALFGLSLLAATSTDWALRKLGQRWKQLHRIVYGIAVLGLLHFFMQSKIDVSEATLLAGLFITLMVYRVMIWQRLKFTVLNLVAAALAGGLLTAFAEFAWYGLATGANPWRIAEANLMLTYGLRPAMIVTLAGLAVAALPWLRNLAGRPPQPLRARAA